MYGGGRRSALAGVGREIRLQVVNDFICGVIWNVSAECLSHFGHFGCPDVCRQWRLHRDVNGAVAIVAVDVNFLSSISPRKVRTIELKRSKVVGSIRGSVSGKFSRDLPGIAGLVLSRLVLCVRARSRKNCNAWESERELDSSLHNFSPV